MSGQDWTYGKPSGYNKAARLKKSMTPEQLAAVDKEVAEIKARRRSP